MAAKKHSTPKSFYSGKTAVILSSVPSSWGSCRIITPNLELAYDLTFGDDAHKFGFVDHMEPNQIVALAREIFESRPNRLVILDHAPHPEPLIRALASFYGEHPLPPVFVHLYGDFTLYTAHWKRLEPILKKTSCYFFAASDRQKSLVSKFLESPKPILDICHFPVNTKTYHISTDLREEWRDRYGVKEDEFLILYTGRLSMQKNSIRLIHEVAKFIEKTAPKSRFLLAGNFDDIAAPFFGLKGTFGFYYQDWKAHLEALPNKIRDRISYIGSFKADELNGLYNAADVYTSLSMHHDEDYGMSPVEALVCGTPCVLSDWGGYASFHDDEDSVRHIPVIIGPKQLEIASAPYQKALTQTWKMTNSLEDRQRRREYFAQRFSIEAAIKIIKSAHEKTLPPFHGFSKLMDKHIEIFANGRVPFPEGPRKDTLYEKFYNSYATR